MTTKVNDPTDLANFDAWFAELKEVAWSRSCVLVEIPTQWDISMFKQGLNPVEAWEEIPF